jgi:hypothetical protein
MAELNLLHGADMEKPHYRVAYTLSSHTVPDKYAGDPYGTRKSINGTMNLPVEALETQLGVIEFIQNYLSNHKLFSATSHMNNVAIYLDDRTNVGYVIYDISPSYKNKNKPTGDRNFIRRLKYPRDVENASRSREMYESGVRMTLTMQFVVGEDTCQIVDIVKMPGIHIQGL